eukprot:2789372-Amphidinium_carterae.1
MSGAQGVNVMASPREWGQIAAWYADVLRTSHPSHFRPDDFLIMRERLETHRDKSGNSAEMKITIFEEDTEGELFQRWPR